VGASRDVRAFIRRWVTENPARTLLLTTHYMVEADELCDRVAIINQGRVLACDTPANLKQRLQREAVFHMQVSPLDGSITHLFDRLPGVRQVVQKWEESGAALEFILEDEGALGAVINTMTARQIRLLRLQKREPTLEDVFVDLVGHSMEEMEVDDSPA